MGNLVKILTEDLINEEKMDMGDYLFKTREISSSIFDSKLISLLYSQYMMTLHDAPQSSKFGIKYGENHGKKI